MRISPHAAGVAHTRLSDSNDPEINRPAAPWWRCTLSGLASGCGWVGVLASMLIVPVFSLSHRHRFAPVPVWTACTFLFCLGESLAPRTGGAFRSGGPLATLSYSLPLASAHRHQYAHIFADDVPEIRRGQLLPKTPAEGQKRCGRAAHKCWGRVWGRPGRRSHLASWPSDIPGWSALWGAGAACGQRLRRSFHLAERHPG